MALLSDPMHSIETHGASLSSGLRELFPEQALTAELRGGADPGALYPEEARHLQKAVRKRLEEFAAGRLCARLLLREFGIDHFAVEVGADRQPLWPEDLVGSITHTTGLLRGRGCSQKIPALRGNRYRDQRRRQSGALARNLHGLGNDLAALFAGVRATLRGNLDLFSQGGVLQMPIRRDSRALKLSRRLGRTAGVGREPRRL